jgi:hypothetical protein
MLLPKYTVKVSKAGANLLRAYLTEKTMDSNFESFSAVRMAEPLRHLYMDIRTSLPIFTLCVFFAIVGGHDY